MRLWKVTVRNTPPISTLKLSVTILMSVWY